MKYLLLSLLMMILASCKTPTTIMLSNCEQREDGSFICDVNGTPTPRNEFCTYEVYSARGADCSSLNINIGTIICVACTPGQTRCPQPAVFIVDGKDCKIKATKISPACVRCPRGGVPVQVK